MSTSKRGREPLLPPHAAAPPHWPAAGQLAQQLAAGLPPTLVALWVQSGRGTILVNAEAPPHYEHGGILWMGIQAQGALWLPPTCDTKRLWEVVGKWLDWFGGSFGAGVLAGRSWRLSAGHGATPALQEAANRLAETLALGYANAWLGSDDPQTLFARAVATYQTDPQALSTADPPLTRWLRGTLFNEGFWRRVEQEIRDAGCGM